MMKCACCGKKKRLLESFENIGKDIDICVKCSDILYRIHDAVAVNDRKEYDLRIDEIMTFGKKKKSSAKFDKWFENDFLKRNSIDK